MSRPDPTRVAFVTIGCRANVADSRMLAEALEAAGLACAETHDDADVFVVNTCTVTHRADADARAAVRRLRRRHPAARIVATGCLAEVTPEALEALPEVDAVLGNRERTDPARLLAAVAPTTRGEDAGRDVGAVVEGGEDGGATRVQPVALRPVTAIRALPSDRTRPFVKIQDGCDNACAYCIIPTARGRSRSLPPDDVLATLRRYGELGAAEVVLTGIHVGMYGRDLPGGGPSLGALLGRIDAEMAGLSGPGTDRSGPRIRLSSLEPDELDDGILDVVQRPRFCDHLHLPLQSGDDDVLRRMGRHYDTAAYAQVVERARAALPNAAIGADVIVGFPGEGDAAFERTLSFVSSLPLTYLHVFSYSPREGTRAAGWADRSGSQVVRERVRRLRAVGEELREAFHERLRGARVEVLLQDERSDGAIRGLSGNYVPVSLAASGLVGDAAATPIGRIVPVVLTDRHGAGMVAEPVA